MHSLQDLIINAREDSNLCPAVEKDGTLCFKPRRKLTNRNYVSKYCTTHQSRFYRYKSFDIPTKPKKQCKFIDCKEEFYSKNLCMVHYNQYIYRNRKSKNLTCTIENCFNPLYVKKMCSTHYQRLKRHGRTSGTKRTFPESATRGKGLERREYNYRCIVPECNKTHATVKITKGLCPRHYYRWRKHKDYNVALKRGRKPSVPQSPNP